jgi:hypothetical protein
MGFPKGRVLFTLGDTEERKILTASTATTKNHYTLELSLPLELGQYRQVI